MVFEKKNFMVWLLSFFLCFSDSFLMITGEEESVSDEEPMIQETAKEEQPQENAETDAKEEMELIPDETAEPEMTTEDLEEPEVVPEETKDPVVIVEKEDKEESIADPIDSPETGQGKAKEDDEQVIVFETPASDFTYTISDGEVTIVQYTGTDTEVEIPAKIEEYPVTRIESRAFWDRNRLTSIMIPEGVTSIGSFAFYLCRSLTRISIPDSVTSIEGNAFSSCYSLVDITIPESVISIEGGIFQNCTSITSITIPSNVTSIGKSAFLGCSSLTSITIPSSVTSIGEDAFLGCSKLTTAGSIGCGSDYEFGWMDSIPNNAFSNCEGITSIMLPNSITSIGSYAFNNCSSLTSITIPDSVTSIGSYAFNNCSSLTSITIPSNVTSIGYSLFSGCNSLKTAGLIGSGTDYEFGWTTTIPSYAFEYCKSLTSITIPDSVTSIGEGAFMGCSSLKNITIPESVRNIEGGAFRECSSLTSVTFPDGVKLNTISLFYECSNLISITIPDSVTSIGEYAFYKCRSLTNLKIPDSVTDIARGAFSGCGNLKTAGPIGSGSDYEFGWTTMIPSYAFNNCSGLINITFPNSVTSIGEFAFLECSSLQKITIPDGVTIIQPYTFQICTSLTSITIPDSVTSIGNGAFAACSSLTSIKIPDSVTSIGNSAFAGCSSLTSIVLPEKLTSINGYMFQNCSNLAVVYVGKHLEQINYYAFKDCNKLKDVYYEGSREDWQKIEIDWKQYGNDPIKKVHVHFNWSHAMFGITISKNRYCIHVQDENGFSIKGAAVTWNSTGNEYSEITDENGNAYFGALTAGEPIITVTYSGYMTYSNEGTNWEKSAVKYSIITLFPNSYGPLMLKDATYRSTGKVSEKNLLTETKKINLKSDAVGDLTSGGFKIFCYAVDVSLVSKYELFQNDNSIKESVDGVFDLSVEDGFIKGGECFIRTHGKDGTHADTHINLEFAENKVNSENSLSFDGSKIEIKVRDEVPYVGGSTLSFDMPINIPLTYENSDNKLKIGFNVALRDPSASSGETPIEKFKDDLYKSVEYYNDIRNKVDKEIFKKYLKENENETKVSFWKSAKLNLLGYAEGDFGSKVAKGVIILELDIKVFNHNYSTVVVVPVTVQIKVNIGAQAIGEISYDWENATFNGGIDIGPFFKLDAFGGAGVSTYIAVGIYGKAKLDILWHMLDLAKHNGLKSADITGELGLKAYAGPLTYDKPFAYNTWYLYTQNNTKDGGEDSTTMSSEPWSESIYDAENWKKDNITYLNSESEWLGNDLDESVLFDTDYTADDYHYERLLNHTYRNARPVMISDGNYLYMSFVKADPDTGSRYLVVSRYDGSSWCEPVRVNNNSILDADPSLTVASNGDILLAYSKTVENIDNTLLSYANAQNTVVGKINKETLSFTELESFKSGNYVYDPNLTTIDGATYLTWISSEVNSDNEVLYPASATIHYAVYENGNIYESNSYNISSHVDAVTLGKSSGELTAAYLSDSVLYGLSLSSGISSILNDSVSGNVRYEVLPSTGAAAFVFNTEEGLSDINDNTIPVDGISMEYVIQGNSIYFSRITDEGAQISYVKYDSESGTWSLPVILSKETGYLENLSVSELDGTIYGIGMNTVATITDQTVTDDKDLVFFTIQSSSDLTLDSIDYEHDQLVMGEDVPLVMNVTNRSDHEIYSLDILLNGSYISTKEVTMLPGESKEIELDHIITCPDTFTEYTLSINETGWTDRNPEDNSYLLKVGYCDVVTSVEYMQTGTQKAIMAYVANKGIQTASGTVTVYDIDNSPVYAYEYENLSSGETLVVTYPLQDDYLGLSGGEVTVNTETNEEELFTYNNSNIYYILNYEQEDPGDETVYVTSITLDSGSITLDPGTSVTLTVEVLPDNATNKNLIWSSSDDTVVRIDETGTLTALNSGTAMVTVTAEDGSGISTACIVTVKEPSSHVCVTGVELSESEIALQAGQSKQLAASILPENASNQAVIWSSSDESIATVNDNGNVTGVSAGTTVITVMTVDGSYSDTCTVTVEAVSGILYGDVSGDGKVNVVDANMIRRHAAKLITLEDDKLVAGDVSGDGKVNVVDANLIRRFTAHLIDIFPVEDQ